MYVWAAVGVLSLGFVALASVLYQVLRQQGRILIAIDSLEQRLRAPTASVEQAGIPVGDAFPSFRYPDATGALIGLEDFRGRRALVVHWSPSCGFCDLIGPELAEVAPRLAEAKTELVLLSYGDVDANVAFREKHGLVSTLLLVDGSPPPTGFAGMGTPVAYLLDERGRVAEPAAVGAGEVPLLARAAAKEKRRLPTQRSLEQSRIERDGLRAGTAAPAFELADLNGKRVALNDYRGRRVLLVFSDPHCGPCDALGPELVRLHARLAEPAIVMVSRGDEAENRQKAEAHGFSFPVAIQRGWNLSKAYGIFATPVAFLIDEHGIVERDVARGVAEIVALAETVETAGKEVPVYST
jgi:peroxiredoxin